MIVRGILDGEKRPIRSPLPDSLEGLKQGVGLGTHSRDVRIDVFYELVIFVYENLIHRWNEISSFYRVSDYVLECMGITCKDKNVSFFQVTRSRVSIISERVLRIICYNF